MMIPKNLLLKFNAELKKLDETLVEVNGVQLKPSYCYFVTSNPSSILFNTYCPPNLKKTIKGIIKKYTVEE